MDMEVNERVRSSSENRDSWLFYVQERVREFCSFAARAPHGGYEAKAATYPSHDFFRGECDGGYGL